MLSCKRGKFTLPPRITYLNCAYMSPLLKSVEKAGIRGLRGKRNPTAITPKDFFSDSEALRKAYSKLVNNDQPNRIAIIPSVSYGMATVAKNLNIRKGENIIVAAEQFPSNYYSWSELCTHVGAQVKIIQPGEDLKGRGKRWNERILEAIDVNTKAVAIAHIHWADGTRFNLEEIRKRTKEVGALLVIDGTQSIGALPFDIEKIKPDAVICAGYKWLLGPYSVGLAYFGEYFDKGKPLEENWINRLHSEDFTKLVNYENNYQEDALRYEVGEHSNFILVPMLLKAIEQLNRWGANNIQEYCKNISANSIATLQQKGFWIEEEEYRSHHLLGLRLPKNVSLETLKNNLQKKNIYVSYRGDAIRVSPNVYNDALDIGRLAKALSL